VKATIADAISGPKAGISSKRRLVWLSALAWAIVFSKSSILSSRTSLWEAQHRGCLLGRFGKGLVGLRERQQFLDPLDALGRDQAELREMPAQRVDGHGSLLDQQIPGLVQHQHGLLIGALDRHEPHVGARHGLADRRCIVRVVLAAFDVGFRVSRRNEDHFVPQRPDLSRPVMGGSTSLHPDPAGRRLGEEIQHLASTQLSRHRRRTLTLDRMHLKKGLRQVDPNPDKGLHGRLPYP
jgi:hypothetical protein